MPGKDEGEEKPSIRKSDRVEGDVAPPGTPGTGENVCPACRGMGRLNGQECPECDGSGKVIAGIGGA